DDELSRPARGSRHEGVALHARRRDSSFPVRSAHPDRAEPPPRRARSIARGVLQRGAQGDRGEARGAVGTAMNHDDPMPVYTDPTPPSYDALLVPPYREAKPAHWNYCGADVEPGERSNPCTECLPEQFDDAQAGWKKSIAHVIKLRDTLSLVSSWIG